MYSVHTNSERNSSNFQTTSLTNPVSLRVITIKCYYRFNPQSGSDYNWLISDVVLKFKAHSEWAEYVSLSCNGYKQESNQLISYIVSLRGIRTQDYVAGWYFIGHNRLQLIANTVRYKKYVGGKESPTGNTCCYKNSLIWPDWIIANLLIGNRKFDTTRQPLS